MALDRQDVFNRLSRVLADLLKTMSRESGTSSHVINLDTDLAQDLGIDSVETLDLLNAIEEEFQVSPNISEANTKRKVSQIVDYIIELSDQ